MHCICPMQMQAVIRKRKNRLLRVSLFVYCLYSLRREPS